MPNIFYENIKFVAGMQTEDPSKIYLRGNVLTKHERDKKDLYYKLSRPIAIILLIIVLFLFIANDRHVSKIINNTGIYYITMFIVIFSFIPCMLVMPVLQYMQVSLVLLTSLLYLSIILIVKTVIAMSFSQKPGHLLYITSSNASGD